MNYILKITALLQVVSLSTYAQQKIKTAPNTHFNEAGKVKKFLFGKHYRKEWATEVEFPVLDLDSAGGGLTPTRLGGGMQTKSLRFKGADGKEYVLRSVNKDPSKALPPEMTGTFADDVLQDQISSSNPYAPPVVASLADAAGIMHSEPRLVYVPASSRLGEFEKEFANTVCLFEERPSDNVVNTEKLFAKLREANDHRVDEKAFLKARLFDMWIGDWDRHGDQWLWAATRTGDMTLYQPIPRDRDQAFSCLDGLIPQMAARKWAIRKTQNFDYTIRDIDGLNINGNFLDHQLTTRLGEQDWKSICTELQTRLTDSVIEAAFKNMPEEIFALSGKEIVAKLKKRRNDLEAYALHYYHFLTNTVSISGTAKQETFEIRQLGKDSTLVEIRRKNTVTYRRVFDNAATKELRLYGLGGNDQFNISKTAPRIRTIPDTAIDPKSFRYDWLWPKIRPGYNPDDGLNIGGGFVFQKQQFGKSPYGYSQSVWGSYAFSTGAYNFWYEGIYKQVANNWDLHLKANVNAPNFVRNYYGPGNETERTKQNRSYYRVRANQYILTPSLKKNLGTHHTLESGFSFQSIKIEQTSGRFVSDVKSQLDSSDFGRKNFLAPFINYQYSSLDNPLYPHKGIRFNTAMTYLQDLDHNQGFLRLSYESAGYLTAGPLTGAIRAGYATNLSDSYEFFQANTLGGMDYLRGYRRDRFAGKSAFYNNTELRYNFSYFKGYFFRGEYGLLSFFDNGRVWIPDEDSHTWHYSYGGGLWFLPYNRMAFTATYGISNEDRIITIKAGFLF
ncbi:MAG TPA: hypothetical protein VI233_02120 [Puia sp.]